MHVIIKLFRFIYSKKDKIAWKKILKKKIRELKLLQKKSDSWISHIVKLKSNSTWNWMLKQNWLNCIRWGTFSYYFIWAKHTKKNVTFYYLNALYLAVKSSYLIIFVSVFKLCSVNAIFVQQLLRILTNNSNSFFHFIPSRLKKHDNFPNYNLF